MISEDQFSRAEGTRSKRLVALISAGIMLAGMAAILEFWKSGYPEYELTPVRTIIPVEVANSQQTQKLTIHFRNTGKRDLRIDRVGSSCGCTVVGRFTDKPIRPGDFVSLEVSASSTSSGTKISRIAVETIPPAEPVEVELHISGSRKRVPVVAVLPKPLRVEVDESDYLLDHTFTVITNEEASSGYLIEGVACNHETAEVKLVDVETIDSKGASFVIRHYHFHMKALGPKQSGETKTYSLTFQLTREPVRYVGNVMVQISFRPPYVAYPEKILVTTENGNLSPKNQIITVLSKNGEPLPSVATVRSEEWITAHSLEVPGNQQLTRKTVVVFDVTKLKNTGASIIHLEFEAALSEITPTFQREIDLARNVALRG